MTDSTGGSGPDLRLIAGDVEEDWLVKDWRRENRRKSGDGPRAHGETHRERAVSLAASVPLFTDTLGVPHADLLVDNHYEVVPVRSRRFKNWIAHSVYKQTGEPVTQTAVNEAIQTVAGIASFDGPTRRLYNRLAWMGDSLWYDLADEAWRGVKVTDQGWQVREPPAPLFRRYSHQAPQVEPTGGGDLPSLLRPLVNIDDDDAFTLWMVWLVAALLPHVPRTFLLLFGSQGSGKSVFTRLCRAIIDPSQVPCPRFPRGDAEMAQVLSHHAAPFFDNLTKVTWRTSDTLCRAVTGDGFSKRKLYSDDDDVVFTYRRVLLLNGINVPATRPDLLDRSILLHLDPIPEDGRQEEAELWEAFEERRPYIMGAIFDALVDAMAVRPKVDPPELPRMADWTRWGYAIALALDLNPDRFLEVYRANRAQQNKEALGSHPLGAAVTAFMDDRELWEGGSADLLRQLETLARDEAIDTDHDLWPGSAGWLTRRLNEVEPNLRAEGITISQDRDSDGRTITLRRSEET